MKHGGENKEMANVFKWWQQSWVGGEGRNSNHILADPPITQSRHLQSKLKNYFPVFFQTQCDRKQNKKIKNIKKLKPKNYAKCLL